MAGALFGIESTTQMLPNEAKLVLGFEVHHEPWAADIHRRLNGMFDLSDLKKGGSQGDSIINHYWNVTVIYGNSGSRYARFDRWGSHGCILIVNVNL
jgi:hypothetical protein